jgi:ABC-type phosphate transport system substrate-binding protein
MAALLCAGALVAVNAAPAVKNMAVVMSAGSKLQDVPLAELSKLCKGTQKTWADGRSFTLVMKDPESPDMHLAVQKLFGVSGSEAKSAIAKLNETRAVVRVVESDEDLLRTVGATPGAVGILDVYAINSSVKVLRVDGKLPFDMGYALKGN